MPPTTRSTTIRPLVHGVAVLLLAFGAANCGPRRPTDGSTMPKPRTRYRSDLITFDDIQRKHWTSVYDLVSELRGNWLNPRGPDSLTGEPGVVQVRLDGVRLGDVNSLRQMPVFDVESLQYFDPISASARWGLGYGHGAIQVNSRVR